MPTNILLCLPAYGNIVSTATFNTTHALAQCFVQKGIGVGVTAFSYPEVSEARNILLTGWYDLLPQSTHMLFIDSDMGFTPDLVLEMLQFGEPMVGALYTRKCLPVQWAASGMGTEFTERRGNFMKVAGLGMGCFLIRRDAIDIMLKQMPELSDTRMEFHAAKDILTGGRMIRAFDGMDSPDGSGRLSEDLAFCARWRQCGGDVWAAIGHEVEHVGAYSYKANYLQMMAEKHANGEVVTAPVEVPPQMKVAAE